MPTESPTKWQVQAYRFGVRRVVAAVARGDGLLRTDGGRRRANITLLLSVILTALLLVVFLVIGFVKSSPTIGKATVVIDTGSGAAYVSQGGRLYPALNLTSALLVAGRGAKGDQPDRTSVNGTTIAKKPRGETIGIPGAPSAPPSAGRLLPADWTVCDTATTNSDQAPGSVPELTTTALVGQTASSVGALGRTGAVLVSDDGARTSYLLWQGVRSKLDPNNAAVRLAFGLTGVSPRPISTGLLNAIPESAPITAPVIAASGPAPAWTSDLKITIGTVFGLDQPGQAEQYYVALPQGVQSISPLLGALIRAQQGVNTTIPRVLPSVLRSAPTVNQLNVRDYPTVRPVLRPTNTAPVVCVERAGSTATATVLTGRRVPLPQGAKVVPVAARTQYTADDVYVRPGSGVVFGEATATQNPDDGPFFVLTDSGVKYPVASAAALSSLGLAKHVAAGSPDLLPLLPTGPTLDPAQAAQYYPASGTPPRALPAPASG